MLPDISAHLYIYIYIYIEREREREREREGERLPALTHMREKFAINLASKIMHHAVRKLTPY